MTTLQTKTRIKEWGNSLGIIIPREIAIKEDLSPNDEVVITITKKDNIEDFFGKGKRLKINSQEMKDEGRKAWKMN